MRRSGITSRSKCAIFSISQISCSSAGPRGPAVMMLVLSATGDPVALVNRFSVAMIAPLLGQVARAEIEPAGSATGWNGVNAFLFDRGEPGSAAPGGSPNDAAEIDAGEVRVLVREHVGVDVAEGRLRLVLVAVVEGLDDVFFEMRAARMRMHHRLALRVAVLGIA